MARYEFEVLFGFSQLFDVEADSTQEALQKAQALTFDTYVVHEGVSYPWDATDITLIDSDAEDW